MNEEVNSENTESFGKLITSYLKDKLGFVPEPTSIPPKLTKLTTVHSWGQFIEFDEEG